MIREEMERTAYLIGMEGVERLEKSHVAVFGVGGVGGFAIEALARAGIGKITIVDHDTVAKSNINRQIIADQNTVNQKKVDVMKNRIKQINPLCEVIARDCFYLSQEEFDFTQYDYVIDGIDTISGKISLIMECEKVATPIISCMGAGNRLDPTQFQVADIYKTSVCPVAKVMRKELKSRGITKCKVVYSKELPRKPIPFSQEELPRKTIGSLSFVPSVAGLILAGEVIKTIALPNDL